MAASRIDILRQIVDSRQRAEVEGVLVDTLTAQVILYCYNAGNEHTKKTIETAPLEAVGRAALKAAAPR